MTYLTFLTAMAVLVVMQCVFVSTCSSRSSSSSSSRRSSRHSNTCYYPQQDQSNHGNAWYGFECNLRKTCTRTSSDYFLGTTPLGKGKRDVISTKSIKHSMILFRGKIFEWGINNDYKMDRSPRFCVISWTWERKGYSKCLLSEAESWTRSYESKYGSYDVLKNNCHMFSNRLADYLWRDCGR